MSAPTTHPPEVRCFVGDDPGQKIANQIANNNVHLCQYICIICCGTTLRCNSEYSTPTKIPNCDVTFNSSFGCLDIIVKWQLQYSMCQKVFLLFYPMVFVYSPEGVQKILESRKKHNDKAIFYRAVAPLLENGLITSQGDKWFKRRRFFTPIFHFNELQSFLEVFNSRTLDYINELKALGKSSSYINICPHTAVLTLNFICETTMGSKETIEKSKLREISASIHRLEKIAVMRVIQPWLLQDWIFKWTKLYSEQRSHEAKLRSFTEELIERRRQVLMKTNKCEIREFDEGTLFVEDAEKKNVLIDMLIQHTIDGKSMDDGEIRGELNTFIFAGHNTTQLAINYCIFLLGCNPEIQKKAIDEVDSIFGGSDLNPTLDDLNKLQYIDCCIKEALRLYPSVPLIARKLTQDEKIGDYYLPRRVDCVIFPYVTHRNPKYFPDPYKFNPDRFLADNHWRLHPYSYIPFSAGPRNCIGKRFAILAVKTVISWILRHFQIESLIKQEKLKVLPQTVLNPIGGLKVKLVQRVISKQNDFKQDIF